MAPIVAQAAPGAKMTRKPLADKAGAARPDEIRPARAIKRTVRQWCTLVSPS
jgi:hypothetical protein